MTEQQRSGSSNPTIGLLRAILEEERKQTRQLRTISINTGVVGVFYLLVLLGSCCSLLFGFGAILETLRAFSQF